MTVTVEVTTGVMYPLQKLLPIGSCEYQPNTDKDYRDCSYFEGMLKSRLIRGISKRVGVLLTSRKCGDKVHSPQQ